MSGQAAAAEGEAVSLAWYWVVALVVWALVSLRTWRLCRRILRRCDSILRLLALRQGAEKPDKPTDGRWIAR